MLKQHFVFFIKNTTFSRFFEKLIKRSNNNKKKNKSQNNGKNLRKKSI